MKLKHQLLLSLSLAGTPFLASAATERFTYVDAANHELSASLTVNVVGGVAIDGTGSATSNLWSGVSELALLTPTTVLPSGVRNSTTG